MVSPSFRLPEVEGLNYNSGTSHGMRFSNNQQKPGSTLEELGGNIADFVLD